MQALGKMVTCAQKRGMGTYKGRYFKLVPVEVLEDKIYYSLEDDFQQDSWIQDYITQSQ